MAIAFSTSRLLVQVSVLLGAGALGLAVLSACGSDGAATEPAGTSASTAPTITAVAPRTTELPPITATETVEATRSSTARASAASGNCAEDIGLFAAARRDIPRLHVPRAGMRWQPSDSGGTWCPGLSWVQVEVRPEVTFPVRPRQLMLYHDGAFQGTGIYCSTWFAQDVVATTRDAITVTYHWVAPGIPEQAHKQDALGRRVVTFRWNGSKIVMEGSPPPRMQTNAC